MEMLSLKATGVFFWGAGIKVLGFLYDILSSSICPGCVCTRPLPVRLCEHSHVQTSIVVWLRLVQTGGNLGGLSKHQDPSFCSLISSGMPGGVCLSLPTYQVKKLN